MKKTYIIFFVLVGIFAFGRAGHAAYGMMGSQNGTYAPADQEEAEGLNIWNSLQSGSVSCTQLSDADFAKLGDYFMGVMMGSSHDYMDRMMTSQLGTDGAEEMHIVMGKRISGCDTSASYSSGYGFMPMMWSGWFSPGGMMGWSHGYSFWRWFSTIVWWILIVVALVFLARWIVRTMHGGKGSALTILKQRYAKGEIDTHEFHERKKELEL